VGVNVVEAAGVRLEPQVAAHAAEMFVVLGDPAIYEFEREPPTSLDWLRTRFAKLETRLSGDGKEQWLNWVIRLPDARLIGYVQATVTAERDATIAYELSSANWGRGLGHQAVKAMISELQAHYGVRRLFAVFRRANFRSRRLLERLGFTPGSPQQYIERQVEPDEDLMTMIAAED
jgi:RimJ/RimL family protein N-acetyltransferase